MATKETKALELLKNNKTVKERAENYIVSVKRNIQRDVIDALVQKKEQMEDELFELTNFSLEMDANRGFEAMTKERVEEIIQKYHKKGIVIQCPTNDAHWGYWERNLDQVPDEPETIANKDQKDRINKAKAVTVSSILGN